ncbi:MAG: EAL domain-containing protein [Planctomycetes bacterium]|nr:EAL domain-containing protein [Planctomycetota bacterium]
MTSKELAASPTTGHRRAALIGLTLGTGIALSLATFSSVRVWEERDIKNRFEDEASRFHAHLQDVVGKRIDTLNSIAALYASDPEVTLEEFHSFVDRAWGHTPDTLAFAWVAHVPRRRRDEAEEAARRQIHPAFRITERNENGDLVPAATRDGYYPVAYVEPMEGNERVLGYDLGSEPARREALLRARDTGHPCATERIRLTVAGVAPDGFLVFHPVYTAGEPTATAAERARSLRGFAVAAVLYEALLRETIGRTDAKGIPVEVVDESADRENRTLYISEAARPYLEDPLLQWTRPIDVAGRHWVLRFFATPGYLRANAQKTSWILLGGWLTVTAAAVGYLLLTRRSHRLGVALEAIENRERIQGTTIRRSLEEGEFIVHYQPVVEITTGRIVASEALVRRGRAGTPIEPPSGFIPAAEASGQIVALGEWVLRTACAQNREWQRAGSADLRVAVNVSLKQLRDHRLVVTVARILKETGMAPRTLDLEITEGNVMEEADLAIGSMQGLQALGAQISIDDFGTGYSSLSHLKQFPIHTLKIDQSFVRDITTDPNDAAIVSTIIGMAHSLHLRAVAEGIETPEQLDFLRRHGCDYGQGFYFSRPVPAEEFDRMLREGWTLPRQPVTA